MSTDRSLAMIASSSCRVALSSVCERAGIVHATPGHVGTTATCPACLAAAPKTLAQRHHDCPCGLSMPRDQASAIMTLGRALLSFRDGPEPGGLLAARREAEEKARLKSQTRRTRLVEGARKACGARQAADAEGSLRPRDVVIPGSAPKPRKRVRGQGRNVRSIPQGTSNRPTTELSHRGSRIRDALTARRAHRRHRRGSLRFRTKRFGNRRRDEGWLAPSLRHRVETTMAEIALIRRWAPIGALAMELVRFDMQAIEDPGISGTGYQQGTLAGYEIREYVLEKWGRHCAYCGEINVPVEVDHIEPRSRGGSDRPSNLNPRLRAL